MTMKLKTTGIVLILLFFASPLLAAGDVNPATKEKFRQVKVTLEQLFKAKEGIYAKDILDGAQRSLSKAQTGLETKKEKAVNQALEMTMLQIEQARTTAEEREAAEKTAVTRAKVDKLEQRLANLLAGKGDEK